VRAVEHLLVGGIQHLEGRHHLARRHRVDLQRAAGDLRDAVGEESEVVVQRQAGRPGRLHLEGDGLLLRVNAAGERGRAPKRD